MKIAFVVDENKGLESRISEHFGHAPYFVIVDSVDGEVKNIETVENPYAGLHAHDELVDFLKGKGVEMVVSSHMGEHMMDAFDEAGIDIVIGAEGKVSDILDDVIEGDFEEYDEDLEELDEEPEEEDEISELREDVDALKKEIKEIKSMLKNIENKLKG